MAKGKTDSQTTLLKIILLLAGIVLLLQIYQIWKAQQPKVPTNNLNMNSWCQQMYSQTHQCGGSCALSNGQCQAIFVE